MSLKLNIGKCRIVSYGRKSNIVKYDYYMGNEILERAESITDLGVIFDQQLKFLFTYNLHYNLRKHFLVTELLQYGIDSECKFAAPSDLAGKILLFSKEFLATRGLEYSHQIFFHAKVLIVHTFLGQKIC